MADSIKRCHVDKPALDQSDGTVSRRKALKIIVGSASAAVTLPGLGDANPRNAAPLCHIAPPAAELPPYKAKYFNVQQVRTLEALSETIIPADEHSPGARAARVWEFMDDLVADSDQATKTLWTQGVTAVDKMAELEHGKKFAECTPEQQIALLEYISQREEIPATVEEKFFVEIKKATVDGYYTSDIGIHQELEYQGNTALPDFPGCTHEEHKTG